MRALRDYAAGQLAEYRVEFRQRTATGEWKWVLSLGKIVSHTPDGRPLRMLGTHTDITERKAAEDRREHLEAQLKQAQKMEAIGQLAGGIAHDFNNLLTIINGRADFAIADLAEHHPLRAELSEIREAGERAAVLVRQLLTFGRRQVVAPEVLSLSAVVSGMQNMLRRLISEDIHLAVSRRSTHVWSARTPGNSTRSCSTSPSTRTMRCRPAGP